MKDLTEGSEGNEDHMAMMFERQTKESEKAFEAFSAYLNMGTKRSLVKVAKKLGKAERLIERWSNRFNWPARVGAYNEHLAQVELRAAEGLVTARAVDWDARTAEQREEEWAVRTELLAAGRRKLRLAMENDERTGSLEGIARILDLASKLGRLAAEMPTEHKQVQSQVETVVRVDLEAALDKIYGPKVVDCEVVALANGPLGCEPHGPSRALTDGDGRFGEPALPVNGSLGDRALPGDGSVVRRGDGPLGERALPGAKND